MLVVGVGIVGWASGTGGIVLLAIATATGFLPALVGCSRVHLLFCLLVPLLLRV
jgi:TctA family transporter